MHVRRRLIFSNNIFFLEDLGLDAKEFSLLIVYFHFPLCPRFLTFSDSDDHFFVLWHVCGFPVEYIRPAQFPYTIIATQPP